MAHDNTSAAYSARNAKVYKTPTHIATQSSPGHSSKLTSLAPPFSTKATQYRTAPTTPDQRKSCTELFYVPLLRTRMSFSSPPAVPPASTSLSSSWDDPEVLRQHLAVMQEPRTTERNTAALIARLALMKNSVKKLEKMKEAIAPRDCEAVNDVFAEKAYKRKFMCWTCFTINSLPVEILKEVFRFVVLAGKDTGQINAHRILLTSVCKYWRTVAIGDMILWNTIYFDDNAPWKRSLAFLERAATAPLDIRIDEPQYRLQQQGQDPATPVPSLTPAVLETLLDVILPKFNQLRIMIIVVDRWDTAQVCLRRLAHAGLPLSLERFELHRGASSPLLAQPQVWIPEPHDTNDILNPIALCDGFTPKLNTICLGGINIDWPRFSSSHLTTLDLRRLPQYACPDASTFRRILTDTPKLRRLSLAMAGPQLQAGGKFQPVPLPALRELLLGECSVTYAIHCLSQFTAPGLRNFTLLNIAHIDVAPLLVWLTGRFPNVELLGMYAVELSSSAETKRVLVRWLDSMPKITMLKIAQMARSFFNAFGEDPRQYYTKPTTKADPEEETPEPRFVAPRLRALYVTLLPKDVALQFINRRIQIGAPLKTFYFPAAWISYSVSRIDMTEIQATGISVRIVEHGGTTDEERELLRRP